MVTMETLEGPVAEGTSGSVLPHLVVEIRGDDGGTLPVGEQGLITIRARRRSGNGQIFTGPCWGTLTIPKPLQRQSSMARCLPGTSATSMNPVTSPSPIGRSAAYFTAAVPTSIPLRCGRVLLGATGVKGVAVVGFPDERLGHRVAAAIEMDSGADLDVVPNSPNSCSRRTHL